MTASGNLKQNLFTKNSNSSNTFTTVTTIANMANSFFNDTWPHIEKTASALVVSPLKGEYFNDYDTNSSSSISMIPSDAITISSGSYSFLENIVNATTTISSTLNSSSLDSDVVATTETPYVPYVMRPETYIVPVLFAFIFIVGVLGNGTLIIVFLTVRQMRNVPNT